MNKIISFKRNIVLCFLMVVSIVKISGSTVTVDKDNIRYTVNLETNEAEVYGPVSSSTTITNLVIPDYIEFDGAQIPVISIRENAFYRKSYLKGSLTIGDNVQTIGDYAFSDCSGFSGTLLIGGQVQTIGKEAFRACSGFSGTLNIPDNVLIIGERAFVNCIGFNGDLIIGENVRIINKNAFELCSGFKGKLKIGSNVEDIGEAAFHGCSGLTGSLIIPDNVHSLGNMAFWKCSGFSGDLSISSNIKTIGFYTFSDCYGLTGSINIPKSVTVINDYAFWKCGGFNGFLNLPSNLISIGDKAFSGCENIKGKLLIPETVEKIGVSCFSDCNELTSVEIISSKTTINNMAFANCNGLQSITCIAEIPPTCIYGNKGGYIFEEEIYERPLYVPAESIDLYKVATEWEKFKYINALQIVPISVSLNKNKLELKINETEKLEATVYPEDAFDKTVVWNSDNENIATISTDGTVTAISVGTTNITATCGDITVTCEVTVTDSNAVNCILPDDELINIYSIEGILIYEGVSSSKLTELTSGIYIIISKKETIKLIK